MDHLAKANVKTPLIRKGTTIFLPRHLLRALVANNGTFQKLARH